MGRYWMYHGGLDTTYNHNGPPNDPRPTCSLSSWGSQGLFPPRSFHPGSVNVLFGDGRVTVVADSVEPGVWTAMGTHNLGD